MGAITDLWKSERGIITVALIIAATVLTALSVLTPERWEQWSSFVKWIFITYTAGKTTTSVMSIAKGVTDTTPPVAIAPSAPAPSAASPDHATQATVAP
jgi:hypothetical protein